MQIARLFLCLTFARILNIKPAHHQLHHIRVNPALKGISRFAGLSFFGMFKWFCKV